MRSQSVQGNTRPVVRPKSTHTLMKTQTLKAEKVTEEVPELLEYEWPDLPPISLIKDAVTRKKVSYGVSYLLPVDKIRISVNNMYRADLRTMFQEPYVDDSLDFDDAKVQVSAKIHLQNNDINAKWTKKLNNNVRVVLNSDSERCRRLYTRSAPSGGSWAKVMGMKKRSNLFLPIKANVPPEAIKMRKEAEKIIRSVKEDDEVSEEYTPEEDKKNAHNPRRKSVWEFELDSERRKVEQVIIKNVAINDVKPAPEENIRSFKTYKEIKNPESPKPVIPFAFRSHFLTYQKNQDIWDWLHHGEELSDFDFFLSVCG